ncbi:putative phage abortive infection protein [Vibrio splendidus]
MKKFLLWCLAVVTFAIIIWSIGSLFIQKSLADATLEVLSSPGRNAPVIKAFFSSNSLYTITFIMFTVVVGIALFLFVPKEKFSRLNSGISKHLSTATTNDTALISSLSKLMIVAAVFFSSLLAMNLGFSFMGLQEQMGVFGDFLGGVLNPILSFLSLIAILLTIILQSRELSETREEIKRSANAQEKSENALNGQLKLQAKQSFESTFFNLLSLHSSLVQNVKVDMAEIAPSFDENYKRPEKKAEIFEGTKYKNTQFSGREIFREIIEHLIRSSNSPMGTLASYRKLDSKHNDILGHYFRNLYQILKLVDEECFEEDSKKRYASMLRAQLSSYELALLFLNCTDGTVDQGEFRSLLCTYQMLEHLPIVLDSRSREVWEYPEDTWFVLSSTSLPITNEKVLKQFIDLIERGDSKLFGAFGTNPTVVKLHSTEPSLNTSSPV